MSSIRSALALRRSLVATRVAAPVSAPVRLTHSAFLAPTQRCLWFPNPGASKKATPTPTPTPEAEKPAEKPASPEPTPEPTPEPKKQAIPEPTPVSSEQSSATSAALEAANKRNNDLVHEIDVLKKRLSDTEEKIATLHESIQDWEQVALRERADAENARRIARDDVKNERVYAIKNFAKDLLEIPDTFASAIAHAKKSGLAEDVRGQKFMEGIEAVERVLLRSLDRHGVRRQEVKPGETIFDPDQHEALTLVPTHGETFHHTVLDVFQPGYLLADRVLRAAKVVVADNPSNPAPRKEKVQ